MLDTLGREILGKTMVPTSEVFRKERKSLLSREGSTCPGPDEVRGIMSCAKTLETQELSAPDNTMQAEDL